MTFDAESKIGFIIFAVKGEKIILSASSATIWLTYIFKQNII